MLTTGCCAESRAGYAPPGNTENVYWIAEADPVAGQHAILRRYPRGDVALCILATDGAQSGFDHHGTDWAALRQDESQQLRRRLDELDDPHGNERPRAKRHDDKTVVVGAADDPATR